MDRCRANLVTTWLTPVGSIAGRRAYAPLEPTPLFDRAGLERWPAGSPLAPQVKIDELGDGGEWGQERLEVGVVETRSTMQGEDDRALTHGVAVGNEGSPLGVEPQVGAVDGDAHGRPFRGTGE